MGWSIVDTWIVVGGVLSAVTCALPGNFLVLRKLSMMGDAISHAVLPGIVVGFVLSGSRSGYAIFIGATAAGLLTALFTQWINHFGKVEESASMGVVFTILFAIGLIGMVRVSHNIDIDPSCVLYGAVELLPLDTVSLGIYEVPRVIFVLGLVLLINIAFITFFFKELKISTFDHELARVLGINTTILHYALMVIVAITTVACFEVVGSILVISMLIVPAATARLLTDRLNIMILISICIAIVCAVMGHIGAIAGPGWLGYHGISTNTSGMMAVASGLFFMITALLAPRYGIVSKVVVQRQLSMSILREDILGLSYRFEEHTTQPAAISSNMLRDAMGIGFVTRYLAMRSLVRSGYVKRREGEYYITLLGRSQARSLVRSHRLWESYFYRHLNLRDDHIHHPASRLEHVTNIEMRRKLAEQVEEPDTDPHGRTIPKYDDE